MNFKEAYLAMMEGKKVTRPCFKGYWYFYGKTGKIVIHLENGDEITEGDFTLTLQNSLAEDWHIYCENYYAFDSECNNYKEWGNFPVGTLEYSETNGGSSYYDKETTTINPQQTPDKPDVKTKKIKKSILG